jgi:hypothetical protein
MIFDEPPREAGARVALGRFAFGAAAEIARAPAALWLVGLYAILIVLSHIVFYLQQPYLESIGTPVVAFGAVFAASKLVHGIVAYRAARIETALGPTRMPAALIAAALAPIALMGVIAHPIGAVLPPLRGVADGLLQPVVHFYLNRVVSPLRRASVLSLASFVARTLQAAALWAFGMALTRLSAASSLRIAAAIGAAAGLTLLLLPRSARRAATAVRPHAVEVEIADAPARVPADRD